MSAKTSPRPWKVEGNGDGYEYDENSSSIAIPNVIRDANGAMVGELYDQETPATLVDANLRLIEKAPELLELLREHPLDDSSWLA